MISNRRNLLKLNILTHHKMSFHDQKDCGQKSPKCEGKVKILNQQVFVNQERGKKVKMGLQVWQGSYSLGGRVVVVLILAPGVVVAPRPPPFK